MGEVVTRLLKTAGQLILRFSQYAEYPARVVLMSHTYNRYTQYQEVLRVLHANANALDSGYSEPLRREARAAGRSGGSQADEILRILSKLVQEELATVVVAIE
ncbi:MAG: hypothetical protein ACKPKO_62450, partial [Candidatus Fonsibacter sp.]